MQAWNNIESIPFLSVILPTPSLCSPASFPSFFASTPTSAALSLDNQVVGWVASAMWWALDQLTRLEAMLGFLWLLCDHARSTRIVGGGNTLGIS